MNVRVTGTLTDTYDFDYDGAPHYGNLVTDAAIVQAGYDGGRLAGHVFKEAVQIDEVVPSFLVKEI